MDLIKPTDRFSCFVFNLLCQCITNRPPPFDLAP